MILIRGVLWKKKKREGDLQVCNGEERERKQR